MPPLAAQSIASLDPVRMATACGAARIGINRQGLDEEGDIAMGENQASAPDIDPITGIGADEDNSDARNRIGWMLGAEVPKVCSQLYSGRVRGPRTVFGRLAKASLYPRVPLDSEPLYHVEAREIPVQLPLLECPTLEQALDLHRKCNSEFAEARATGASQARPNVARRYVYCAQALRERVQDNRKQGLDATIQAIVIGDLAIGGFPAETFAASGMEAKRRSPFAETLFCGYSNG